MSSSHLHSLELHVLVVQYAAIDNRVIRMCTQAPSYGS